MLSNLANGISHLILLQRQVLEDDRKDVVERDGRLVGQDQPEKYPDTFIKKVARDGERTRNLLILFIFLIIYR
jgi:hypothetical protein